MIRVSDRAATTLCAALLLPLALLSTLASRTDARADTETDGGIWGVLTATGSAAALNPELENFRWWLEGQARFRDEGGDFDQAFIRPGVGYAIIPEFTIWLGYGWFRSSPETDRDFDEHRIWQQLSWSRKFDPITLSTRTRIEQRFLETGDDTGGRFRQRIVVSYPLSSRFDFVVNDEVFINLNSTDWGADGGFDQNRGFVGFGWRAIPEARFEIGYLNQFLNRSGSADAMNHILVITLQLSP